MKLKKRQSARNLSDFDRIVQTQIRKSVVVTPSDPNGGAKLPKRQEGAPQRKGKGKSQYMAVFDREANQSDDQLDDWLDDTQVATQSNDDYVEDGRDDDAPEDPDDESFEDSRGDDVYDPYDDDEEDDMESLDVPDDDEYVSVRSHKRRKLKKSIDDEYEDDTDDDDDLDEGEGDDEEDEPKRGKKDEERRKKIRKSLGADAMKYVDGSPIVKSLVDAIMDWKDETTSEIRQLRMENKTLHARMNKLVQRENRQMAKALVASQAEFSEVRPAGPAQSIRKSVASGAPIQTSQRALPAEFNLAKSLDVLEEAYVNNGAPELRNDMTQLELYGANAIGSISRTSQEILQQNRLL